jgi:hypothetical protein
MPPRACEDCGGDDLVLNPTTADVVCRSCGRVGESGGTVPSYSDASRTEARRRDGGGPALAYGVGGAPARGGCDRQGRGGAPSAAGLVRTASRLHRASAQPLKDYRWIRDAADACALPPRVADTAVDIAASVAARPFWVHRKNNNLLGVRVACLFHAAVIHETPRDHRDLADACGVPRRSVKNMIAVTQPGHDDVARAVFRGCGTRTWQARTSVASMIPRFLSGMPWLTEATTRLACAACLRTAEAVGGAMDNHCPKTIMVGVVAYSVWSSESLTSAFARELTSGASSACAPCLASAVGCCDGHVKAIETELAARADVAVATLRQTCDKARQVIAGALARTP